MTGLIYNEMLNISCNLLNIVLKVKRSTITKSKKNYQSNQIEDCPLVVVISLLRITFILLIIHLHFQSLLIMLMPETNLRIIIGITIIFSIILFSYDILLRKLTFFKSLLLFRESHSS
jgi:hypothetical protein